jgi:hypothetical protein
MELANAIWQHLAPSVPSRSFLGRAVLDCAADPTDEDARRRLQLALEQLLGEDGDLAVQVRELWQARAVAGRPAGDRGGEAGPRAAPPETRSPRVPGSAATAPPVPESEPTRLGLDSATAPAPTQPVDDQQVRRIGARFLEHDNARPLEARRTYTLALGVSSEGQVDLGVLQESRLFQPGEELIDLTVILLSRDLRVHTPGHQRLLLPRTGPSLNRAYFDVEPLHDGAGKLTAAFFRDNNFVQGIVLEVNTGKGDAAIAGAEPLGRPLDGAFAVQPRNLTLFITKQATGFDIAMVGAVAAIGSLRMTPEQLHDHITLVREALQEIVYLGAGPDGLRAYPPHRVKPEDVPDDVELVYQTELNIPDDARQEGLGRLAKAGYRLYQQLFYGGDPGAALLGDRLRALAESTTLKIQIVSEDFVLPWGILYLADVYQPENVDPERFLGFRHIVEHIPLQRQMTTLDPVIPSQPSLSVSLNLNQDIDRDSDDLLGVRVVAEQVDHWNRKSREAGDDDAGSARIPLVVRTTRDAVLGALQSPATPDKIFYVYSHAGAYRPGDPLGPRASFLGFTGDDDLTLDEVELLARADPARPLPGAPLVFINACRSSQMSPLFYESFLSYFIRKGARGMIGGECDLPALFAASWAKRFFDEFLGGTPLGQAFLSLRREFYRDHGNILGLAYAVYCDGDTRILPGLQLT